MSTKPDYTSIDDYIMQYPQPIQVQLEALRQVILSSVPKEAKECISWGMPTYYYLGYLVHFAAHKHHIGFYPGSACVEMFHEDLKPLKHSKGTIQIPYDYPIPIELIQKIVVFRIQENRDLKKK